MAIRVLFFMTHFNELLQEAFLQSLLDGYSIGEATLGGECAQAMVRVRRAGTSVLES